MNKIRGIIVQVNKSPKYQQPKTNKFLKKSLIKD
jgi:hypothetical protein